jgi:HEPN domain-containing protein
MCREIFKALLEELDRSIPRTHDLLDLLHELLPTHSSLKRISRGTVFLTQFAVEFRYPGKNATKRQALAALRWAERIRQECRTILGIKPPRRKKP